MLARFGWTEGDSEDLDRAVAAYEATILPEMWKLDGFRGTFACIDRSTGRAVVVTLWRDKSAMSAHERVTAPRFIAQVVETSGVPEPTVDRYEVVLWNVDAASGTVGA
jgi:hypothetical protein